MPAGARIVDERFQSGYLEQMNFSSLTPPPASGSAKSAVFHRQCVRGRGKKVVCYLGQRVGPHLLHSVDTVLRLVGQCVPPRPLLFVDIAYGIYSGGQLVRI